MMRILRFFAFFILAGSFAFFSRNTWAQNKNVGIGTLIPDSSAILELKSTDRGLLIPRTDTGSINTLGTPATGLLIYQLNDSTFYYFDGLIWRALASGNGPTGPTGADGPTGPQGAQGLPGATGTTGTDGATGAQGIQGITGPQGTQGLTGADGTTGAQGIQGATGPTGADGMQGITGAAGPTGTDGATGAQGIQGATGTTGTAGNDGATGATGADGTTGPQGAQGLTGATGTTGADGTTGPTGVDGATGAQGLTGATGADGALNAWSLTGNAGTTAGTNFIGTTDAVDWQIRTNNLNRMYFTTGSPARIGINTITPTPAYLQINATSSNNDGIRSNHSSGSTASAYYAIGGDVSNAAYTNAFGYVGYHTSGNRTFGIYGTGGNWSGMFAGKVGINSDIGNNQLSYDLEVRNESSGNPAAIIFRQTAAQTTSGTALSNLDFGDNHTTSAQARIQVERGAAGAVGDLPTDIIFSNIPDGSAVLTERMRITNAGTVGINTSTPGSNYLNVTSASSALASVGAYNTAASGSPNTIYAENASPSGNVIKATATSATGGSVYGIWGQVASSTNGAKGIYGQATATTGVVFGMDARNSSNDGFALRALNSSTTAPTSSLVSAIFGQTEAANTISIWAVSNNSSATQSYAIWGETKGSTSIGMVGVGNGTFSGTIPAAGAGGFFAGTVNGVYATSNNTAGDRYAGFFGWKDGAGNPRGVYVGGIIGGTEYKITGDGTPGTFVKDFNNNNRAMFCPEAPEIFFQDFGKAKLVNGKAHVELDAVFSKNILVDEKHPLHVFIQLYGNCKGVYVANSNQTGFDVIELESGAADVEFGWFVTANRADEMDVNGKVTSKNANVRFPLMPGYPKENVSGYKSPVFLEKEK